MTDRSAVIRHLPADFDYSTPEAQLALEGVTSIVLEIRDEFASNVDLEQAYLTAVDAFAEMEGAHAEMVDLYQQANARVALYERTLGLAVIPILLRRAAMRVLRRSGGSKDASVQQPGSDVGPGGRA